MRGPGHGPRLVGATAMDQPCRAALHRARGRLPERWRIQPLGPSGRPPPRQRCKRWPNRDSGPESIPMTGWSLVAGATLAAAGVAGLRRPARTEPAPPLPADWFWPSGPALCWFLDRRQGECHRFGGSGLACCARLRLPHPGPCWPIARPLAETPCCSACWPDNPGVVLIVCPGATPWGPADGASSAFSPSASVLRMYRGRKAPSVGLGDVYGLACLERA